MIQYLYFILGVVITLVTIILLSDLKVNRNNNVRFYITKHKLDYGGTRIGKEMSEYTLWIGRPEFSYYNGRFISDVLHGVVSIATDRNIIAFGLSLEDFVDMKDNEMQEVIIDTENHYGYAIGDSEMQ